MKSNDVRTVWYQWILQNWSLWMDQFSNYYIITIHQVDTLIEIAISVNVIWIFIFHGWTQHTMGKQSIIE